MDVEIAGPKVQAKYQRVKTFLVICGAVVVASQQSKH
jgi:hypothetical protein